VLGRGFLLAALVAAVLVPIASANRAPRMRLAVIPLPKPTLGSRARGLALGRTSGAISNTAAASSTSDATELTFQKLGRVSGYALVYGSPFDGADDVTSVRTGVEEYKTSADAKRGLVFWRREDAAVAALDHSGFSVRSVLVKVPAVGTKRFAFLTSFRASNIAPVSSLDEQVADGRYVLDVTVTAGSAAAAKALAPPLAKKLDARLRLALEGRLHARPTKLPPKQKAGPARGGPDLSKLALNTSDLVGGQAARMAAGYRVDPRAVSDYGVYMQPAGPFDVLYQEIEWYPTANEASFETDWENAYWLSQPGTTVLDLGGLGAGAQGSVSEASTFDTGQIFFSSGHLAEFINVAVLDAAIGTTDVTNVAQSAATKIDVVLGG